MKAISILILLSACAAARPKPPLLPKAAPVEAVKKVVPKMPDTIDEAEALRIQLLLAEMREAEAKMDAASKTYQIKRFLFEQAKKMLAEKYAIDVDRGDDWQPVPGGKWKIVRKQEVKP